MENKKSIKSTREIKNIDAEPNKLKRKIIHLKGGSFIIKDFENLVNNNLKLTKKQKDFYIEYYKQNPNKITSDYVNKIGEIKESLKEDIKNDRTIINNNIIKLDQIIPKPVNYDQIKNELNSLLTKLDNQDKNSNLI